MNLPQILKHIPILLFCSVATFATASDFEQLGSLLPDPNEARLASGAPGPGYWQQEANYRIEVELDEANARIIGSETVEYVNNSPHTLKYIWVQLDQNALAQGSKRQRSQQALNFEGKPGEPAEIEFFPFRSFVTSQTFDGGYKLISVTDADGEDLSYTIVSTNMRIDLPSSLTSGESFFFKIDWEFPLQDEALAFRHGKKKLKNGDYAYHLAQWYPRMCAYYDEQGWQLKPYIGYGEFALEFGQFEVHITVPEDFVVASTGKLSNPDETLTTEQRQRLQQAKTADTPTFIITPEEADANLKEKSKGTKTWVFNADNVRDFAFATSRGYIWDAKGIEVEGNLVMAMSVYPKEASALWKRFSTEAAVQTIKTYSQIVYPYPYPVIWSAWGAAGGMEYPMISFQSSNIDDNETYSLKHRNYVIRVVIHEIGHNWFPMIINNDERQWMWLDEGLNTFVENIAATKFDQPIQDRYEEITRDIIQTMAKPNDPVIMTTADSLTQRGFQAYRKPALGLTILRESILGKELFDFAFHEYAKRWAFKRPTPADFFRTLEDASGVDLDWFWHSWFFGNDHVDMSIDSVSAYRLDDGYPERSKALAKQEEDEIQETPYEAFLKEIDTVSNQHTHLQDWYYNYDKFQATEKETADYLEEIEELEDWEKEQLTFTDAAYVISIKSIGGLAMPLILDIQFEDGSDRRIKVPAEIWRRGNDIVKIPFISKKTVSRVQLDRDNAFGDSDLANNVFPRIIEEGRFKLKQREEDPNPMREALFPEETKAEKK